MGRLYIKRKDGRGLISVERCIRENKNSLGFYIAKSEENLIKGVAAAEIINTEDIVISGEIKKQKAQELNKTGMKKKTCMDKNAVMCFTGTDHQDKLCKAPH